MIFILDTNIVLDWIVFNDLATHVLRSAVSTGSAVVATHAVALDELQRVLEYPALKLDANRRSRLFGEYANRCAQLSMPDGFSRDNLLLPSGFPQCRDRDDQPFIALAYHGKAALVSKDKAVLKLRKRAAKFSVEIIDVAQMNGLLSQ